MGKPCADDVCGKGSGLGFPVARKPHLPPTCPQLVPPPSLHLPSQALYRKLTTPPGEGVPPMFAAAELLVALHCPEPGPGGALALSQKAQMAAVDTALHSPDIFPQHAIAQVGCMGWGVDGCSVAWGGEWTSVWGHADCCCSGR